MFSDSTSLVVTKHHLVLTADGLVAAGSLNTQDLVQKQNGDGSAFWVHVDTITHTAREVASPITTSGWIRVNDDVASCYAHGTHDLMHLSLGLLRALHQISPSLAIVMGQAVHHTKVLLDKGIIDKSIIRTKVLLDKGIVRN